jgi:hypothetical protein
MGDRRRAIQIYEQLLAAMMEPQPDTRGDLIEATNVSTVYYFMAGAYRRAGEPVKADDMDARRLDLWRHWDEKLPGNSYVQRQLAMRSE